MIRIKRHHVTADKILKNMEIQQSSNKNGKLRSLQASGRSWARSQNYENRLLALSCLPACLSFCPSVRPSVQMEQLGFHCTDFYEISHLKVFRKPLEKIKVLLKSDKNNGYVSWLSVHKMRRKHLTVFQMKYSLKKSVKILLTLSGSCHVHENLSQSLLFECETW